MATVDRLTTGLSDEGCDEASKLEVKVVQAVKVVGRR